MRHLLVKQIAQEKPAAIILNGDVPNDGKSKNDYAVYKSETQRWQDERLLVIATLGNHEMFGDEKLCLENWWDAFPQLRNMRWYSTQLGSRVYIISLDSTSSLLRGSEQAEWLAQTDRRHEQHGGFSGDHNSPSAGSRRPDAFAGRS